MEWRTIPGYPAYEVNTSGAVRKAGTGYALAKKGRRYVLWDGKKPCPFYPYELIELAFSVRETEPESLLLDTPVPAAPDDDRDVELERENRELRALVAELEAELLVYRVAI